VARIHLDAVAQLDEALQRVEETLPAFDGLDCEIWTCGVADEQGVSGEHEPRLVCTRAIDHGKGAVLRAMPGGVDRAHDDVADGDLHSVLKRLVPERHARRSVNVHGDAVLEREPTVPGDMIGVRVRLDDRRQLDAPPQALIQVLVDRVGRIDDDGGSGMLVADQVGSTPEVVIDELLEEHETTLATKTAISPEVRTRLLILAVLVALAAPGAAWAHATLVRTSPASGAVVAHAPSAVRVVFDDVVKVGPGITAVRNSGGTILAGRARIEAERTLVIPLRRGLGDGDYSVRWSIVSDDGHIESGVLAFGVGAGRSSPTSALRPGSNEPQTGSVISRWLFFIGVLGAVGIALFALVTHSGGEPIALVLSSSAVLAAFGAAQEAHRVGLGTRAGAALGSGFLVAVVGAARAGAAAVWYKHLTLPTPERV
jgi:methionine-rich copper-binding protein CopC